MDLDSFSDIRLAVQSFLLDGVTPSARWWSGDEVFELSQAIRNLSRHDLRRLLKGLSGETTPAMREAFWAEFFDAVACEHPML